MTFLNFDLLENQSIMNTVTNLIKTPVPLKILGKLESVTPLGDRVHLAIVTSFL